MPEYRPEHFSRRVHEIKKEIKPDLEDKRRAVLFNKDPRFYDLIARRFRQQFLPEKVIKVINSESDPKRRLFLLKRVILEDPYIISLFKLKSLDVKTQDLDMAFRWSLGIIVRYLKDNKLLKENPFTGQSYSEKEVPRPEVAPKMEVSKPKVEAPIARIEPRRFVDSPRVVSPVRAETPTPKVEPRVEASSPRVESRREQVPYPKVDPKFARESTTRDRTYPERPNEGVPRTESIVKFNDPERRRLEYERLMKEESLRRQQKQEVEQKLPEPEYIVEQLDPPDYNVGEGDGAPVHDTRLNPKKPIEKAPGFFKRGLRAIGSWDERRRARIDKKLGPFITREEDAENLKALVENRVPGRARAVEHVEVPRENSPQDGLKFDGKKRENVQVEVPVEPVDPDSIMPDNIRKETIEDITYGLTEKHLRNLDPNFNSLIGDIVSLAYHESKAVKDPLKNPVIDLELKDGKYYIPKDLISSNEVELKENCIYLFGREKNYEISPEGKVVILDKDSSRLINGVYSRRHAAIMLTKDGLRVWYMGPSSNLKISRENLDKYVLGKEPREEPKGFMAKRDAEGKAKVEVAKAVEPRGEGVGLTARGKVAEDARKNRGFEVDQEVKLEGPDAAIVELGKMDGEKGPEVVKETKLSGIGSIQYDLEQEIKLLNITVPREDITKLASFIDKIQEMTKGRIDIKKLVRRDVISFIKFLKSNIVSDAYMPSNNFSINGIMFNLCKSIIPKNTDRKYCIAYVTSETPKGKETKIAMYYTSRSANAWRLLPMRGHPLDLSRGYLYKSEQGEEALSLDHELQRKLDENKEIEIEDNEILRSFRPYIENIVVDDLNPSETEFDRNVRRAKKIDESVLSIPTGIFLDLKDSQNLPDFDLAESRLDYSYTYGLTRKVSVVSKNGKYVWNFSVTKLGTFVSDVQLFSAKPNAYGLAKIVRFKDPLTELFLLTPAFEYKDQLKKRLVKLQNDAQTSNDSVLLQRVNDLLSKYYENDSSHDSYRNVLGFIQDNFNEEHGFPFNFKDLIDNLPEKHFELFYPLNVSQEYLSHIYEYAKKIKNKKMFETLVYEKAKEKRINLEDKEKMKPILEEVFEDVKLRDYLEDKFLIDLNDLDLDIYGIFSNGFSLGNVSDRKELLLRNHFGVEVARVNYSPKKLYRIYENGCIVELSAETTFITGKTKRVTDKVLVGNLPNQFNSNEGLIAYCYIDPKGKGSPLKVYV